MPPKKNTPDHALISALKELQTVSNQYVDIGLISADVNVDMKNIVAGFKLPSRAAEAFAALGISAPRFVDTVSLEVNYRPLDQEFQIETGAVGFGNKHGLAFSSPRDIPEKGRMHHIDLVLPLPSGKPALQPIGPAASADIQQFFHNCGLELQFAPEKSGMNVLLPIQQEAAQSVITRQSADPCYGALAEMNVISRISAAGSTMILDGEITQSRSRDYRHDTGRRYFDDQRPVPTGTGYVREVSLEMTDFSVDPPVAVETVLRADTPNQPLSYRGMYEHEPGKEKGPPVMPTLQRVREISTAFTNLIFPDYPDSRT